MSQKIEDQIATIERALGERMIEHALVIVRSWLNELGENNPYEEAYFSIHKRSKAVFDAWLSSNNENVDERLNELTGEMYQMVDSVYADIRLKRGISPEMHGFNEDNTASILNYFHNCVRLREEDVEWFQKLLRDESRAGTALTAITAIAQNIRENFSLDGFLMLIEGMNVENETVADQCAAQVITLLIHYDVRIDFFPQIQEAFLQAASEMNDDGEQLFDLLCRLIESFDMKNFKEAIRSGELTTSALPKELQKLIQQAGLGDSLDTLLQWMPKTETEYIAGLIEMLPQTWVYTALVEGIAEREKSLAQICLSCGFRDVLWDFPDVGEKVYRKALRKGAKQPIDYINYAHCLLLNGDRVMAYEYYRQARKLCSSPKTFFNLFRPDRRPLIDHGVPIEQVYMIEDQLLNN